MQLFCVIAFSQKQHLRFEHIGTSSGLSQSNVMCILQDSRGFMWFGTRDGLNKYDGYNFIVYKYDASDKNSLSQNTIQDIAEDNDGNLWIATWGGGLEMFDRATEKFIHQQTNIKTPAVIGSKLITSLLNDSDGNLWIGTEGQGLQMYDKKNKRFISYVHDENDPKTISDNIVKDIVEDQQHNLWIGTNSGGVNLFDRKTKSFRRFLHDDKNKGSVCSNVDWALFIDSHNQLWVGSRGEGLDLFDRETEKFHHFKNNSTDVNGLQSNVIKAISEDEQGNIWVGTENGGLSIFNNQTRTFETYLQDDADNEGINNNSIWSICKDAKGNMWVGSFSAGINFANRDATKFVHYRHNSSPLSLNNNNVLSILEDSNKNLWIGTDGGGMSLFDAEKGSFTQYKHEASNPNSICGDYVLKIFEDSEGDLWIGTWGTGITVFNKKKNTYRHFKSDPAKPNGLSGNNAWTIAEDTEKNIWIGLYNAPNGVDMYDRTTKNFVHYGRDLSNPASLNNNTVSTIFCDRDGNIWIGTNGGGLDLFNKKTKDFTHFNEETKNRISNNDIYCLAQDHDGNLWIGTGVGLNKMDKRTGKITSYYLKDGLPSNTITGILADDQGNLWLSTYKGLSKFDLARGLFKNFAINDGLQSNEFKMNSCYRSRSGKMYFGGINGFNEFSPDNLKEKKYEPPLVFTDFQIFNKRVEINNSDPDGSPLNENITDTKELVLSHSQSVVSFEFASLNYAAQDKKQYSYILEGFDKEWNNIGTRHTATYTNLDPGKYTLKVRGLNNEGEWSTNVATLQLTVTPPFWLTWWFRVIAVLAVAGSVIVFYRLRMRTAKRQQRLLEQKVNEQTIQLVNIHKEEHKARLEAETAREDANLANDELEKKNKELEQFVYIASHDLREPLRTTSSFVELLQKQYKGTLDDKADKYLLYISQASDRMKVLISDLLDYSRIGNQKELQQVDCAVILEEVLTDLDIALTEAGAYIDRERLPVINAYPVGIKQLFQNLVANGVKFRQEGIAPRIRISAKDCKSYWQFAFADNGIGIEEKHSERIFVIFQRLHTRTEYDGTGIGLAHCKKIVEMHGGKIWVESKPGAGSTFYFTILKNKN